MKRGQIEGIEFFIPLLLMTVAVIVSVLLVRHYADVSVDATQMEKAAYLYRIYYDDVIMYSDQNTKRVYPGIVDLSKFTTQRLDSVFQERGVKGVSQIASCMTLHDNGKDTTICNDKETFDKYASISPMKETWPVGIRDGAQERAGTLEITIVRPTS